MERKPHEFWVEKYMGGGDNWEPCTNRTPPGSHLHVAGPGIFRMMVEVIPRLVDTPVIDHYFHLDARKETICYCVSPDDKA